MPHPIKEYIRQLHHKKSVRAVTTAVVFLALPGIGAYSYLWGVKRIKLDRVFLPIGKRFPKLRGLKIAQISDLHYGPTNKDLRHFERAVQLIQKQQPDLIVLTGDYYQWDPEYQEDLPKVLGRLSAPLGVFGVFGNHDYGACYPGTLHCDPFDHQTLKQHFAANNIAMLCNENIVLDFHGQKFNLAGLHDLWSGLFDPTTALVDSNLDLPTVLLSHNPDTVHLVPHDFDLMLSGHLHGGQLSLPFVGAVTAQSKNSELRRGLYQFGERKHLYINRGLGQTFRLRLNSPPEVTVLEIV